MDRMALWVVEKKPEKAHFRTILSFFSIENRLKMKWF